MPATITTPARRPFANTLPATKSQRNRGYRFTPPTATDAHDGVLTYEAKGDRSVYTVVEFPADLDGRAFRCTKPDGESYDVLVGAGRQASICDCRGFERFGTCKHVDCLTDLIAEGQLPDPRDDGEQDFGGEFEDYADGMFESYAADGSPVLMAAGSW